MTQEQKTRIAQLRQQNVGYASIARELSLSINTVINVFNSKANSIIYFYRETRQHSLPGFPIEFL